LQVSSLQNYLPSLQKALGLALALVIKLYKNNFCIFWRTS